MLRDFLLSGKRNAWGSVAFKAFLYALGLLVLGALAWLLVCGHRRANRGICYGIPPDVPLATVHPFGVNVSLEQYDEDELERALTMTEEGGFRWLRQCFPWAEIEPRRGEYRWQRWDRIVAATGEHGLEMIAVLDTSPGWAQGEGNEDDPFAPPHEVADYGGFVRAFVERYQGQIRHFQIWDEPNLNSHWGGRYVDPAAYTSLLREGYIQVKTVDPKAVVLTAGLAPTVENGPANLNEVAFLQGMYAAGARGYFDILALKPYGFWSGPDDRRVDPAILNFSRPILLREAMVENGDEDKAIWAVEFGWNALPADWAGRPPPWGTDAEEVQVERTVEAVQRGQEEWPWLGGMIVQHFQPAAPPDDPVHGFALVGEDFTPRPLYWAMQRLATAPPLAHIGRYPADHYTARYEGEWRLSPLGADIGQSGDSLIIPFKGTRLDLTVRRGDYWGLLYVTVDGGPANALPQDEQGHSYLLLYDPLRQTKTITLATGLPDAPHQARLVAEGGWGQWAIVGWSVIREEKALAYRLSVLLIGGSALVVLWPLSRLLFSLPWLAWGERLAEVLRAERLGGGPQDEAYGRMGEGLQIAVTVAAAALFYFSPSLPLSLLSLAILALLVYLRLDLGLALVAFSIPFFLYPKPLGPKAFSMVEVLTLLCCLAWLLGWITGSRQQAANIQLPASNFQFPISSLSGLDYPILFFFLVSALSLFVSQNLGVSVREFRVVVLESTLFYFLLRGSPLGERGLWRIVHALVLATLAVSLVGLYQYFFTTDVITAEGVRRIRGVYGSPNNLSLFLGRIVPVMAAVVLFGSSARRRVAYALAGVPILLCLYLTYSRGAWLLGLPAAFLFIGLLRGWRAFLASLGALCAALVSLLPFMKVERLTSLFDFSPGSTTFLRLKLWQGAINMIRHHPIFGVGLDNFLYQYRTRYLLPEAWEEPNLSHPHNIVLDYWTRLGFLGVAAMIWLETAFFGTALRLYRRQSDADAQALLLGLMASMVAFLAHGLIDNSYFLVDLAFVFMLALGVVRRLETRRVN